MIIARDVKIVKCNNTFCTCCIQRFFYDRTKTKEKKNDKQQFSPVCTIVDRLLTNACNKDFIVLVQLRCTFSTKNNAINTHFLHDRRKKHLSTIV
jgi:flagellar basal body-associated protein FliL